MADLRAGDRPRRSPRARKTQGHDEVWEFSWAPDGRATFPYGDPVTDGEPHIVWRRVGTHAIFTRP
ncbi:hypothetical protein [Streptomyces hainanensis]|uniref:hypothetical protein n=1 Tax=Streptomyces hainanensis TaxID=402648 RepID=UPI001A9FB9C1|nr:hypothetical protein [Streptomyces hainanensis]